MMLTPDDVNGGCWWSDGGWKWNVGRQCVVRCVGFWLGDSVGVVYDFHWVICLIIYILFYSLN